MKLAGLLLQRMSSMLKGWGAGPARGLHKAAAATHSFGVGQAVLRGNFRARILRDAHLVVASGRAAVPICHWLQRAPPGPPVVHKLSTNCQNASCGNANYAP